MTNECIFRRILAILALVALVGALMSACSSTPDRPDEVAVTTISGPVLELPMPEATVLVLRVEPEGAMELIETALRLFGESRQGLYGEMLGGMGNESELKPTLVGALLTGRPEWFMAAGADHESQDLQLPAFSGLDDQRSILVALSTRGNEEHLRHLRNGIPPLGAESMLQGFSWRVFLPAVDEAVLQNEIEAFGDEFMQREVAMEGISAQAGYVVVDVHSDPRRRHSREQVDGMVAIDFEGADETYWDRHTPALAEFLQSEAAVGIYLRSQDVSVLTAMMGSREVLEALAWARPEYRDRMMARGFEMVGASFFVESPEVREYEDLAITFESDSEGAISIRGVRTFTEVGAWLASRESQSRAIGVAQVESPLLDISWWGGWSEAEGDVLTPIWMDQVNAEEGAEGAFDEIFYSGGVWLVATFFGNYPRAFAAGMRQVDGEQIYAPSARLRLFGEVLGLRGSLGWDVNSGAPLGGAPRGGMALLTYPESRWQAFFEEAAAILEYLGGGEVDYRAETEGGLLRLEIAMGSDQGQVSEGVAPGTVEADFDLAGVADILEAIPGDLGDVNPWLLQALRQMERAQLRGEDFEEGSAIELRIGGGSLSFQRPLRTNIEFAQPSIPPPCRRDLQFTSRKFLGIISMVTPDGRASIWEGFRQELEDQMNRCATEDGEVEEEVLHIYTGWSRHRGLQAAMVFDWERALASFDDACQRGAERACAEADEVRSLSSQLQPARVSRVDAVVGRPGSSTPVVTEAGLGWLSDGDSGMGLNEVYSSDELGQIQNEEHPLLHRGEFGERFSVEAIEVEAGGVVPATVMHIDARTPLGVVGAVADFLSTNDISQRLREAQLMGEPGWPEGPLWSAFMVASTAEEVSSHQVLIFGGGEHLRRSQVSRVGITIIGDGDELIVDGERLAIEELMGYLAPRQNQPTPIFVIEDSEEVEFAALVRVHQALGQWTDLRTGNLLTVVVE